MLVSSNLLFNFLFSEWKLGPMFLQKPMITYNKDEKNKLNNTLFKNILRINFPLTVICMHSKCNYTLMRYQFTRVDWNWTKSMITIFKKRCKNFSFYFLKHYRNTYCTHLIHKELWINKMIVFLKRYRQIDWYCQGQWSVKFK